MGYPPPLFRLKEFYQIDLLVFDYIDETTEEFAICNDSSLTQAFENADIITVVSQRLFNIICEKYPFKSIVLLPNAADIEHFHLAKELRLAVDIVGQKQPLIGFMGSISTWIDIEFLTKLVQLRRDWNFVFIGPDYIQVTSQLALFSNVSFLGRKMYQELLVYIGSFDVGIVPFQVRDMTHSSSSIKMYEYLAAGIPCISTPIQEALSCPFVVTGAVAEEWVEQIDKLLKAPPQSEMLQQYAATHSWKERITIFEAILDQKKKEILDG